MPCIRQRGRWLALALIVLALCLLALGTGRQHGVLKTCGPRCGTRRATAPRAMAQQIVWDIRLPRTLGAWVAGALLGLGRGGAGLFRNPLADPYLLGSASGASLGVALALALMGAQAACWAVPKVPSPSRCIPATGWCAWD